MATPAQYGQTQAGEPYSECMVLGLMLKRRVSCKPVLCVHGLCSLLLTILKISNAQWADVDPDCVDRDSSWRVCNEAGRGGHDVRACAKGSAQCQNDFQVVKSHDKVLEAWVPPVGTKYVQWLKV